uniref:Profilin n=1 Tax=Eptatretus burgeri TaxID=7764 RepID=A0A8C4QD75_EPTBU
MGDWKKFVAKILTNKKIQDVAIIGRTENKAVWASMPGGPLAAISPTEVGIIVGKDRNAFLHTTYLGGTKGSQI